MQVEIDKFGRVIIPKVIRNHLGIKPGTALELIEHNQEILLRVLSKKTPLKKDDGVLVYTGEAYEDIENALKKERDHRLNDLFE